MIVCRDVAGMTHASAVVDHALVDLVARLQASRRKYDYWISLVPYGGGPATFDATPRRLVDVDAGSLELAPAATDTEVPGDVWRQDMWTALDAAEVQCEAFRTGSEALHSPCLLLLMTGDPCSDPPTVDAVERLESMPWTTLTVSRSTDDSAQLRDSCAHAVACTSPGHHFAWQPRV